MKARQTSACVLHLLQRSCKSSCSVTDLFDLLGLCLGSKGVEIMMSLTVFLCALQIHNWSSDFQDPSIPSMEFCSVGKCYTVIDGVKQPLDVTQVLRRQAWLLKLAQLAALDAN